jgi:hypothetical protein
MMLLLVLSALLVAASASAAVSPGALAPDAILLSFGAYCGDAVVNFTCYWCKQLGSNFVTAGTFGSPSGVTFGYVGVLRGQYVVVAWRGTDNIRGFIQDADFTQTQFPGAPDGVRAHSGFLKLVTTFQPKAMALYEQAQASCGGDCPVLFTGHSLGAAMSTMSAVDFAVRYKGFTTQILNFGSPRIFNPAGATWVSSEFPGLNITHVRVTSTKDPVPHLPPEHFLETYQHSGTEFWESSNSPLVFQRCVGGEDPTCADSVHAWDLDVVDHARYMGLDILDGVPHGCLYTDEFADN